MPVVAVFWVVETQVIIFGLFLLQYFYNNAILLV